MSSSHYTLAQLRRLSGFDRVSTGAVVGLFEPAAVGGYFRKRKFNGCFDALHALLVDDATLAAQAAAQQVVDWLFDLFANERRRVSACAFLTAATVLCNGSRETKMATAFALYNGGMSITRPQLANYFTAVYRIVFASQPAKAEAIGVERPEELADVTAETAFAEAELDDGGRMSLSELHKCAAAGHA